MNYKVLLMPIAELLLMKIIVSTATLTDGLLLFFLCRIFGKEKTKELPNIWALFRLPQNSKFFHSLSITSIFRRMHGALNVGKKNN